MAESRKSTLRHDLFGGLVSASLAIPLAMGYGMFAFTALGDSYFAYGALAGLYAAIAVGVVCVVLGDRTTTVYAPRVTTTFLLGVLLTIWCIPTRKSCAAAMFTSLSSPFSRWSFSAAYSKHYSVWFDLAP